MRDPEPSLSDYAAAVGELVLFLREDGSVLTSMDQHLLASWWEAGYPLPTVLRAVRETGERLKRRKRPPRGLPLSSMRKVVEREGGRAVARQAAAEVGGDAAVRDAGLAGHALALLAAESRDRPPGRLSLLAQAAERLQPHAAEDDSAAFAALLGASRCYYDALLGILPESAQQQLRADALAEMGPALGRMAPAARENALEELMRRRLRESDPILDPLLIEEGSRHRG
ncbi:MAG: hypothetical protein KDA24_04060 [Deltaproteobacteria bacterium]|nr:hypothetical protein [Deltaproteobacteria bacterium]